MKAAFLYIAAASLCFGQTPGLRGRSANGNAHGQGIGYLGVGVVEVTPERAKVLKLSESGGVEIKRVDDDSPAAKAGIKVDDVIIALNGQKVEGVIQFIGTIGVTLPGAKMAITVWREGLKKNLTATLEARPLLGMAFRTESGTTIMTAPPSFEVMIEPNRMLGIDGETLTPQLAQYFGVREGVLVRSVTLRSPADKAGLKAGDVIVKVNGTPINSIKEILGAIRGERDTFAFIIFRNHREMTLNVEFALESNPWREWPGFPGVGVSFASYSSL